MQRQHYIVVVFYVYLLSRPHITVPVLIVGEHIVTTAMSLTYSQITKTPLFGLPSGLYFTTPLHTSRRCAHLKAMGSIPSLVNIAFNVYLALCPLLNNS